MQTPLYACHIALGARIAPFSGWDMPIQYAGILAEHVYTRTRCSVFDTCHMGEFELSGPTAEADLERLLTLRVATLREGQCRYGYLLREDGGVLDDLTCYRLGPDRFMLCVNAGTIENDARWIRAHVSKTTQFRDLSPETGKLDVQGPTSRRAVEHALGNPLPELGYFRFSALRLAGTEVLLSRTGYTGEWGYEIYLPASEAVRFWNLLLGAGEIRPAGLGARDTLRLEMGYPLYGHELSVERTPVGAARGQFIAMDKDFIGKEAVKREVELGPAQYLVGLKLETKRAARASDKVLNGGRVVGAVTSGSLAPSLGVAVALAYVDAPLAATGQRLEVVSRGTPLAAEVVDLPFYRHGTARRSSPPGT